MRRDASRSSFPNAVAETLNMTYPERLSTFEGYWNEHTATAYQLAAIGHVYDRPPLEAIEEGSRCISCSHFVRRDQSMRSLEGDLGASDYRSPFAGFSFHHPSCIRLQVRIPLDPQATLGGLHGGSIAGLRHQWESKSNPRLHEAVVTQQQKPQTSSIFNLPTELRLQIYALVLPALDEVAEIVPLNRDSARIATKAGTQKIGPRDLTKTNLLGTCRAIHNEALATLYDQRTYRFANSKTLYLFLRHIGTPGRSLLKSIDVYCGSREDAITFSLLAACPKLRAITLRLPRAKLMFPRAPIWWMDGMAALLSLRGLEEVRFGDCGAELKTFLEDGSHDAAVVRTELRRTRGMAGTVRWVHGCLDL